MVGVSMRVVYKNWYQPYSILRQKGAYNDLTADILAYVDVAFFKFKMPHIIPSWNFAHILWNTYVCVCVCVCVCARVRVCVCELLQGQSYAQLHIIYICIIIELYNISSWCSTLICMNIEIVGHSVKSDAQWWWNSILITHLKGQ